MIVNITRRQREYVDRVVERGPLWDALHRDVAEVGRGKRIEVTAPYLAWEIVKYRVMDKYLTRTLGRGADTPLQVLALLRNIAKAQNTFDRHPALRGAAMLGQHDGWFPLWTLDGVYSPMPAPGGRFVVLGPDITSLHRSTPVTIWTTKGLIPTHHWLASEESHTSLLPEQR